MTYLIVAALITCSALFSGLTLGLMGLDTFEVRRKRKLGDPDAKKVYPIRKRGNELLTALLLGNVAVNSILAIYLGDITTGALAGFISTALIFVFGEIIPQAVISRHAMKFGAITAPGMKVLLFLMSPITKPVAWVLDRALGDELPNIYSKHELAMLIAEHEGNPDAELDSDEKRIIHGALQFSDRAIHEIMTPRTVMYMLEADADVGPHLLEEIKEAGYSRIPLYGENPDDIQSFIHVRDLLGISDGKLSNQEQDILRVQENDKLDKIQNLMLTKKQHMAIVQNEFGVCTGLVTLEDILEEVIGREILDEDDEVADLRADARRKAEESLSS
jgi:metal transporter CNNM